jgi:hypothetical protein
MKALITKIIETMAKQIYQIQIVLTDIEPKIWRRLLVNSDTSLVDLHRIIQTAMGWTNSHLHRFNDGVTDYSPKEFEVEDSKDSRKVKLKTILNIEKSKLLYEYDFGDGWNHDIILEKIIKEEDKEQIPRCLKGEGNCPPEDCGGTWGYEDLLKTISDSHHEDYESMMEWLGGEFDPNFFDQDQINQQLKQKDYGCMWIE